MSETPQALTPEAHKRKEAELLQIYLDRKAVSDAAQDDKIEARLILEAYRRKWIVQLCVTGCGNNAEPGATMCGWCTLDARRQIAADRDDKLSARDRGDLR